MVDGRDDPGQSQAQEDVDRVAARHVTNRVIRSLLVDGSDLAGEGVRERGAQGNKCDGSDLKIIRGSSQCYIHYSLCPPSYLVLQSHETAEYPGQISHHNDDQTNHGERDEEARVAASHAGRRDDGEDQLEIRRKKSK